MTGPDTARVWRDDVATMNSILDRLRDSVPGLRWVLPAAQDDGHTLVWDSSRHGEERLGLLCDWANEEWPP
jgi:hypothetical protein